MLEPFNIILNKRGERVQQAISVISQEKKELLEEPGRPKATLVGGSQRPGGASADLRKNTEFSLIKSLLISASWLLFFNLVETRSTVELYHEHGLGVIVVATVVGIRDTVATA